MTYLTLGQVTIPVVLLAFFIAIFYSDFRNRQADALTNKLLEQMVFTYMFVWKLSYILFSWTDFIKAPLSVIYFDGGLKGHLLAVVILIVVLYMKRQTLDFQVVWLYWTRFVTVYALINTLFQEQWLFAGSWLIVLLLIERRYHHMLLLLQFLLLAWLYGFTENITLAHFAVLLTVIIKTRQMQYVALAVVMSLVAVMLGDVTQTNEGKERLAIHLPTTTGTMVRLADQPEPLTVVNFFATWCPPCKAEMPHLQSLAEDLPMGVELIGVNLTARDDGREALDDFMATYDVTYPILLDEKDKVGTAFQVISIPTTVLLNKEGEELERIVGPISEESLRQLIKKYQ